ncbi:MAG: DEAD/DEAH box helicase [Beijerinckiaceae bacterium]|nr:DEAD/DEAH box helicase [Beijerinckiaceae bacterium]
MSVLPVPPSALHPLLAAALARKGYDSLTPVQSAVADPALAHRDLLVSSKTGSGKTVAYGLGIAPALLGDTLPPSGKPLALVIAPTRELALQVQRELRWLYEDAGAIITSCVGGMDSRAERKHLERGVHIVVGTPGRLVDHLTRGALDLGALAAIVLDEADEMLDLGFREDLETLLAATPAGRRTLLFSATLPKGIVALATRFQRDAARIEVASDVSGHADIEHRAAMVRPHAVEHGVVNLLRQSDSPATLVFCNTREAVRHLHATLTERGFAAVTLSGELGQNERNQALQALRDGRARVCIATDVAARGIDLPHLGLVIHADLPHDSEVLQHRSGRTGRAGRKGISVMLVPPAKRRKAERLFAEGGIQPRWVALPGADEIRQLDRERMLMDESPFQELSEFDWEMASAFLSRRSPKEIAAALARVHRQRLPEPEEIDPLPVEEPRMTGKGKPGPAPAGPMGGRWFELSIGRANKAEPKGILKMLVRRGNLERHLIGAIRIHDRTTEVEISADAAEKFERRMAKGRPDEVSVRALAEPTPRQKRKPPPPRPRAPEPARAAPPRGKPHRKGKRQG